MSDSEEPTSAGIPLSGISLGLGGAGGFDISLSATPEPAPPAEEPLLPRGGLVALRKSGGLRFTSRSVVVYRSGRALIGGGPAAAPRERRLSAEELERLKGLILRARLARQRPTGSQPADGYAYEIAARVSKRLRSVEVYDGAMPEAIRELVEALSALY